MMTLFILLTLCSAHAHHQAKLPFTLAVTPACARIQRLGSRGVKS
jgi:hypothetical protein